MTAAEPAIIIMTPKCLRKTNMALVMTSGQRPPLPMLI